MFLPRIIPILLLKGKGLVKTVKFANHRYIGDPINAVKIFNDLKTDELVFLDITASKEERCISIDTVIDIGEESLMPFAVGGGIRNITQIEELLKAGAEKVVINTNAIKNPKLITEAASNFGSQSVVVSIDVKKELWGKHKIFIRNGTKKTNLTPVEFAKTAEEYGAGELIINSIDRDGIMNGYDITLIKSISESVNIPVIACGGAGSLHHMKEAYYLGGAHALAAGSLFVYHGPRKAVLINYPEKNEVKNIFWGERI